MRIGIVRSLATTVAGGVFQYEMTLLRAISEIATRFPEELVYLSTHPADIAPLASVGGLNYRGLPILPLAELSPQQPPPEFYTRQQPPTPPPLDPNVVKFDDAGANAFKDSGAKLLFMLSPSLAAFSFRLPFVTPILDLNHRLQPQFPEVSAFGESNRREYFYINTCRFATLVVVDSEVGKDDVIRLYGNLIDEDRIRVLPYYPLIKEKPLPERGDLERVRAKYNLPKRYFFYPAQFWRHKNHALILHAMKLIADEGGEQKVVFCGSYQHYTLAVNFQELMALAQKLGIGDRIRYLGTAPDQDMAALYTLSSGLVMPTFFGPTNIPPLEAWHFERPVITSDITGMREQIGDGGLLVDPRSPQALAGAMKRLWHDEALRAQLVAHGSRRLASYSWSTFVDKIAVILADACERVRAGRTPQYADPKQRASSMQCA
jgi:glycosyltransferase involved in cell wall biosynthesis